MSQTISLPKSAFENLLERISRLETVVFGKKKKEYSDYIKLTPAAKKRYKKMDEDIKKGKNIYTFDNSDDALQFLLSDKRK